MNYIDYYVTLNISRDASNDEIKKAYRRLVFIHHPDQNHTDEMSDKKIKEINEAYAVLSNPEKRRLYDQFRFADFEKNISSRGSSEFRTGFPYNQGSNAFCGRGRGCGRRAKFKRRSSFGFDDPGSSITGEDKIFKINITSEEADEGTKKIIIANTAFGLKKLQLNIMAGVENGTRLKFSSKNEDIRFGDFYVQIDIQK